MEHFEVTLDAQHRRIYFVRPGTGPITIPPIEDLIRFGAGWRPNDPAESPAERTKGVEHERAER